MNNLVVIVFVFAIQFYRALCFLRFTETMPKVLADESSEMMHPLFHISTMALYVFVGSW